MKKIFIIDGGAGRVISAIPALKKYVKNNPTHNVTIFVRGWDSLTWSIPELQDITFASECKGHFKHHFMDADEVISPEPYYMPRYYRQEISLSEAFDQIINQTTNHEDLDPPQINLMPAEVLNGQDIIDQAKSHQGKDKTLIIQPFGRSADFSHSGQIFDPTSRSIDPKVFLKLCERLSTKYNLILIAEPQFHLSEDTYTFKINSDMRGLCSVIGAADYFVGCDSLGQHIARALNKPGMVILGSTFAKNVSYPDHFQIVERDVPKVYAPIRINQTDCNFADRSNEECMNFTDAEIDSMVHSINETLKQLQ